MSKQLPFFVQVAPERDSRVWRWNDGHVFRLSGTSRATGKPVAPSRFSGLISAALTSHSYRPESTESYRGDRAEVSAPAIIMNLGPSMVDARNHTLYLRSEEEWQKVTEVFPLAVRTGVTSSSAYSPEPVVVNGRTYTDSTVYLEWYDAELRPSHSIADEPKFAVMDRAGYWRLRSPAFARETLTDAAHAALTAAAVQIGERLATDVAVAAYNRRGASEVSESWKAERERVDNIAAAALKVERAASNVVKAYAPPCWLLPDRERALAALESAREDLRAARSFRRVVE